MAWETTASLNGDVEIHEVTLEDLLHTTPESRPNEGLIFTTPESRLYEDLFPAEFSLTDLQLQNLATSFAQYQAVSPELTQQSESIDQGVPVTSDTTDVDQRQSSLQTPSAASSSEKRSEEHKRQKNREAAKMSRRKKKEAEVAMRDKLEKLESENERLKRTVSKWKLLYVNSLRQLRTRKAFYAYLQQNKELVRDPDAKPVLQKFLTTDFLLLCD